MSKKMLIDATHPEETRVVVVDGSKVEEFDFESLNKRQLTGNIYLAKVTRVEPSLQAAFVEYGGNRHGFLAFSEIHPDYYQIPVADREALLAAEEREEQADAEEATKADSKPRRSRRSNNRRRDSSASTDDAMTVVDLAGEDAQSGDAGDVEPAAEPEVEASAEGDAGIVPPAEVSTDETTASPDADDAGGTGHDDSTPRSIAESAGTDDGESISEEAAAPATANAPAEAEPPADEKPKRRPRRSRKKATESTDASEGTEGETSSEDVRAEAAIVDPAKTEAASEVTAAKTTEPTETGTEAEDGDVDAKPKARRRRSSRSRRGRRDDEPAATADADAATDAGSEPVAEEPLENLGAETVEDEVRPRRTKMRSYKIQEVIKVRQIMLVQVVKEERGNKGAALTTYLSLAGRYCVLMPNTARGGGISRKITNADDRKKLKEIAGEFEVPKGMGLIIRTAGAQRTRTEIKRDYEFLLRQWDQIRELTLKSIAPTLIYEEGSLIKRSIRDLYTKDIEEILVAGDDGYREAKDYMRMLMPSHAKHVQPYREATPLFTRYQVESYLAAMFNPVVQLRSGGYIVIGVTEALVAIDVNSGRSTREGSIEDTALKTNLEAADEVARQLRLRDLAGLIVIDFIDMDERKNNAAVEKRMKERLKNDRARIQMGRISAFGLMEMSRQRLRPGMLEASTAPCPHCHGTGLIRSLDSLALSILREIEEEGVRRRSAEVRVVAPVQVANFLINSKREHVAAIELRYGLSVLIEGDPALISPEYRLEKLKSATRPAPVPERPAVTASGTLSELDDPRADEDEVEEDKPAESRRAEEDRNRDSENGKSRRRRGRRGGRKRRREEDGTDSSDNGEAAASTETGTRAEQAAQSESVPEVAETVIEPSNVEAVVPAVAPPAHAEAAQAVQDAEPAAPEPEPETVAETAEPAPEPAEPEPETAAKSPDSEVTASETPESPREPEAAIVGAETPEPAPEAPRRPRRTGWWSLGSR